MSDLDGDGGAQLAAEQLAHIWENERLARVWEDCETDSRWLPDSFWQARPVFGRIRQAAHSRLICADGVLNVVLVRVMALMPHTVRIPPIVAYPSCLSHFLALVGPPGSNKGATNHIAAELVPGDGELQDQLPMGTGEGLAELLYEYVADGDGKRQRVQVHHNAFVWADEGQVLNALGKERTGSILLPTLRSIWSGNSFGQQNADATRRRKVPAYSYVFGVVLAFQPELAKVLLADVIAGTPQRFAWAPTFGSNVPSPDEKPEWPGELRWSPPVVRGDAGSDFLTFAPDIHTEVEWSHWRGGSSDPMSAHNKLLTLKFAAALALLDGRLEVDLDDWLLARLLKRVSDNNRAAVMGTVARSDKAAERAVGEKLADRAVQVDEAKHQWQVDQVAKLIGKKVWTADDGTYTRKSLRRSLSSAQRRVFDEAYLSAVEKGGLAEVVEAGQGEDKRAIHRGAQKPPS